MQIASLFVPVGICAPSAAVRLEKEKIMPRVPVRFAVLVLPALSGLCITRLASACDPGTSLPLAGAIGAAHGAGIDAICPPDCVVDVRPGDASAFGLSSGGGDSLAGVGPVVQIDIVDFAFDPDAVVIKPNTTVQWSHIGLFPHTTTGPTWDSGQMGNGADFPVFFGASAAGTSFDYVCSNHFGMQGNVTVVRFGDANLDLQVNSDDFNVLATSFGTGGHVWEEGDFTGDGFVNSDDFNLLASNFGEPISGGDAINIDVSNFIPEPASAIIWVVLAGLAPGLSRRR